jgi:hypothetical protein
MFNQLSQKTSNRSLALMTPQKAKAKSVARTTESSAASKKNTNSENCRSQPCPWIPDKLYVEGMFLQIADVDKTERASSSGECG